MFIPHWIPYIFNIYQQIISECLYLAKKGRNTLRVLVGSWIGERVSPPFEAIKHKLNHDQGLTHVRYLLRIAISVFMALVYE